MARTLLSAFRVSRARVLVPPSVVNIDVTSVSLNLAFLLRPAASPRYARPDAICLRHGRCVNGKRALTPHHSFLFRLLYRIIVAAGRSLRGHLCVLSRLSPVPAQAPDHGYAEFPDPQRLHRTCGGQRPRRRSVHYFRSYRDRCLLLLPHHGLAVSTGR